MTQVNKRLVEQLHVYACERPNVHEEWLSFVDRNLIRYQLASSAPREPEFSVQATSRGAEGWAISRFMTVAGSSRLVRRSADIAGDTRERYIAYISLKGCIGFEQFDRAEVCPPGSLTLISGAEPLEHLKQGGNDTIGFVIPREFVDQRLSSVEDLCARPVPMQQGLGHLVQSTLLSLHRDAAEIDDTEFCSAARVIGDLILMAVTGSGDLTSRVRSVRTSNLARVKKAIRERLADPELRLADVAEGCGMSLSYMHNLFRDDRCTAWEYLKAERLQRARQRLQTTPGRGGTVTDIAMDCGFSNMSQFSTAFRAQFGVSPREVLRQA